MRQQKKIRNVGTGVCRLIAKPEKLQLIYLAKITVTLPTTFYMPVISKIKIWWSFPPALRVHMA